MRNCKQCNELIGDEVTQCPFCNYEYTNDEMQEIHRAKAREEQQIAANQSEEINHFINKFNKTAIIIILFYVCLLVTPLIMFLTKEIILVWYIWGTCMLLFFAFSIFLSIRNSRCPACGCFCSITITNYLSFSKSSSLHCSMCGETFKHKAITYTPK